MLNDRILCSGLTVKHICIFKKEAFKLNEHLLSRLIESCILSFMGHFFTYTD